jgi:tripartite-type tricarboxylate transporter receptor subunit TctC
MTETIAKYLSVIRRMTSLVIVGIAASCWCAPASAADAKFPTQPIQLIVPYAAGGGTDTIARYLQKGMESRLGQPILVINRPGASTTIGTLAVTRATPDGHTLGMVSVPFVTNYSLLKEVPYALNDLIPVASVTNAPSVLVVNPSLPIKSVADLVSYIKTHPGQVNYATFGIGSGAHLAALLFESKIGTSLTAVHYRGGAPAALGVMTGEVQLSFGTPVLMSAGIASGQLRPLAVTASKRLRILPDVPTMREQGYDYTNGVWFGVVAPKGTPDAVVQRVHQVIAEVMAEPAVEKILEDSGSEVFVKTPREFADFIASETKQWAGVLKNVAKQ